MKIQLVNSPCDIIDFLDQKWYLPLGLISIGTVLEKEGFNVELLDGQHLNLSDILKKLDADIIGINFTIFSTKSFNKIIECAKKNGAFVVVGGHAATYLYKQLLRKNENIDIVVRYDGEEAFLKIIRGIQKRRSDLNNIPNIAYRKSKDVIENNIELVDLKKLPIPNRNINGINMEKYIQTWNKVWENDSFIRTSSVYSKKGCPRLCSFCARIDKGVRERTPQQSFDEYQLLVEKYNVNYIYEVCDTFFSSVDWLREFRQIYEKNGGLNARIWAFADIRDISEETVEHMAAIGVYMVLIGIETGNERIRRINGKEFSNEDVLNAVKLLGKNGIKVSDSYILGLIDETPKTISDTIELSKRIGKYCEQVDTAFSIILPLPGSVIWKKMMQIPELNEKYSEDYEFNVDELREDYLSYFCKLNQKNILFGEFQ